MGYSPLLHFNRKPLKLWNTHLNINVKILTHSWPQNEVFYLAPFLHLTLTGYGKGHGPKFCLVWRHSSAWSNGPEVSSLVSIKKCFHQLPVFFIWTNALCPESWFRYGLCYNCADDVKCNCSDNSHSHKKSDSLILGK